MFKSISYITLDEIYSDSGSVIESKNMFNLCYCVTFTGQGYIWGYYCAVYLESASSVLSLYADMLKFNF